jgi:hypothetical protein
MGERTSREMLGQMSAKRGSGKGRRAGGGEVYLHGDRGQVLVAG